MKKSPSLRLLIPLIWLSLILLSTVSFAQPNKLFVDKGCIGCHTIAGQGGHVGPVLDGVAERYSAHWLAKWLSNPSAVKPGTKMPNLGLNEAEINTLVDYLVTLGSPLNGGQFSKKETKNVAKIRPENDPNSAINDYLNIGVDGSYLAQQRHSLQDQIQSFIPPMYEPVLTQSAFVLPPGAMRIGMSYKQTNTIDEGDVAGQMDIGARFVDFKLDRQFIDLDYFVGLDNNFTFRVNVPIVNSQVSQQINPAFLDPISAFPQGSYQELGDISLFLKKKFIDQGNFPFALAGVFKLSLPTGKDSLKFDPRTLVSTPMGTSVLGLPAINQETGMPLMGTGDGTFRRFTDNGELPAPLQTGLGTYGYGLGIFATRIFENNSLFGNGSIHTGLLYELRPKHNGVDPGDKKTAFVSFVKSLYKEQLALDISYILKDKDKDSYKGLIAVPTGQMPPNPPIMIVPRRSFSGGTTQMAAASLIYVPNPLFKVTLSYVQRLAKPQLGPSPDHVLRLGFQHTFASDLFQ